MSRSRPRRRRPLVLWLLLVGMVGCAIAVLATPPVRRWPSGPTEDEVALATARARSEDLKSRLDAETAKLRTMAPPPTDGSARARADDLAAQLADAEARLRAPRPREPDVEAIARADDLSRQAQVLSAQLSRPRPVVEEPVVAGMTREQILASRDLFGLFTPQSPFNLADVHTVERTVGKKAQIIGWFQSWAQEFRPDAVRAAWKHGSVPLVTWESRGGLDSTADDPDYSLPRILSGRYDEYIRGWARGIAALGLPLVMRFDHEMNAPWYPWAEVSIDNSGSRSINGNDRGDYARTWRHVHRIFEEEGANRHVIWLWAPTRVDRLLHQPHPSEFYPGDEFVDWIGMSGYLRSYDTTPTFESTYGATLAALRATSTKPILLAEIGATEIGGNKAAWEQDLFRGLAASPDIIGFVWFNFAVTSRVAGQQVTNDWRIDSSPASIRTMRDLLGSSPFGVPVP